MGHLFRFLLRMVDEKFWGDVHLRFKDGKLVTPIRVERDYTDVSLPQPTYITQGAAEARIKELMKQAS